MDTRWFTKNKCIIALEHKTTMFSFMHNKININYVAMPLFKYQMYEAKAK